MDILGLITQQPLTTALIGVVAVLSLVLLTVLFLTYLERKVMGHIQMRLGPMRVGFHGALQAPADAIKLLVKEDLIPASADNWVFRLAPYIVFAPTLLVFMAVPFTRDWLVANLDLGLFFIVAVPGLAVIGLFMAGWASNNKYALIGGVRCVAQMVSYELPLVISLLGVAILAESLNLSVIVEKQTVVPYIILQPIAFIIYLVSSLAELNRTPFDIPVAESEVIGGPHVEYSGMRWAMFFLSEYGNTFAIAAIGSTVFLGGWQGPVLPPFVWFLVKTYAVIFIVFWLRATLPRLRVDQLMGLAWKFLLPLSFVNLILTAVFVLYGWWVFALAMLVCLGLITVYYAAWRSRRPVQTTGYTRPATVLVTEAPGGEGP